MVVIEDSQARIVEVKGESTERKSQKYRQVHTEWGIERRIFRLSPACADH